MSPSTQRTKIGPVRKVPHLKIWIEGTRLREAGFTVGTRYHRAESAGCLILTRHPEGAYKVSGKGDKPIIDTSGSIVTRLFPLPTTHVTVAFTEGVITITPAS